MALGKDQNGNVAQVGRIGAATDVTSPGSYAVVGDGTFGVRLLSAAALRVKVGSAPSATDLSLAAGVPEVFALRKGETIFFLGTGTVNVAELY